MHCFLASYQIIIIIIIIIVITSIIKPIVTSIIITMITIINNNNFNNNPVGILLVVSHDQVFLDSICTDIIELKSQLAGQSKSCLTHYSGDYSSYTNTVEEQRVAQQRLRVAFEKERDKLKEFIARDGKKYDNPAHQSQRKVNSCSTSTADADASDDVDDDVLFLSINLFESLFDQLYECMHA